MANNIKAIGIDHGTTNSSIAVMERDKPRVILPNGVDEVMPSAVFMHDQGSQELVGWEARRAMFVHFDKGTGYTGYKRQIGQDDDYVFRAGRTVLKAHELGARVLRALLQAYQRDLGADPEDVPKAAVITVPAMFDQSACDGTREAARQAGLLYYPQLQEPIAASLAYGFTATGDRSQWMIFDLGGGTLDISLVYVRSSQMDVPAEGHLGDQNLGGRDLDNILFDYVLAELSKQYNLEGFTTDKKYRAAKSLLLIAVEDTKIMLSDLDEAPVSLREELCKDRSGKPVHVNVLVSRSQYEKMIASQVDRAVHQCQMLLERNRLAPGDIDSLILIGGPTKTPYIKEVLVDRLGIPLEDSIDPMTAVAQGAALYAETHEIPEDIKKLLGVPAPTAGITSDRWSVQLVYQNHSQSPLCPVAGVVTGPTAKINGLTVEISSADGKWSSGPISVTEEGTFNCDVQLPESDEPKLRGFVTVVRNSTGEELASAQQPNIWHPYVGTDGALKVATSLRVAVVGNRTETLITRGTDLPGEGKQSFETTRRLRHGESGDVLHVSVVQSVIDLVGRETAHADACFHVGTLKIEARDERVTQDLPEGTSVDVTLRQDESRMTSVKAFIPLLDEVFDATFTTSSYNVTHEQLSGRLEQLRKDLAKGEQLQTRRPLPEAKVVLETIRRLDSLENIATELQRAREGNREALYGAYKQILQLRGTLHHFQHIHRWTEIEQRIDDLRGLAEEGLEKDELHTIEADYASADPNNDTTFARVTESLDNLDWRVRRRPVYDLYVDLRAISGKKVTNYQHEVFKKALALWKGLHDKGGVEALTEDDLASIISMRRKIEEAYPELNEWRTEDDSAIPQNPFDDLSKAGEVTF